MELGKFDFLIPFHFSSWRVELIVDSCNGVGSLQWFFFFFESWVSVSFKRGKPQNIYTKLIAHSPGQATQAQQECWAAMKKGQKTKFPQMEEKTGSQQRPKTNPTPHCQTVQGDQEHPKQREFELYLIKLGRRHLLDWTPQRRQESGDDRQMSATLQWLLPGLVIEETMLASGWIRQQTENCFSTKWREIFWIP